MCTPEIRPSHGSHRIDGSIKDRVRKIPDPCTKAEFGKTINTAREATYMMTAVGMVSGGLGITILPKSSVEISAFEGIRSAPVNGESFVRTVSVIAKTGRMLPPFSQRFAEELIPDLR